MNITVSEAIDIRDALEKTDALIHAADEIADVAMAAPVNSTEANRFYRLFVMTLHQFEELKELFDKADKAGEPRKEGK